MTDVYTVETSLVLRDDLIVGLRRAADAAGDLESILLDIERRLGALGRGGIAGTTAAVDEMKVSATALKDTLATLKVPSVSEIGLTSLNRSLGIAEGRAARLRENLASLSVPAGTGIPLGGGGRGHAGGGHGGGLVGGAHSGAGGGFHPTVGMNIPTGIGAAIGYGVFEEAQVEDLVNRVMLASNESVLGPGLMQNPLAQKVRDIVRGTRAQTGMSAHDAGEALMPVVLQMAGLPLGERLDMAPTFEKFAFVESKLKGVDPAEASSSLIGLLHMTGSYTPEAINRMAAATAYASTISPQGLPSIEKMASYAMPGAMTAGIDPAGLLLVLANAQSAGVTNTKAGTWFDALFHALSPAGGIAGLMKSKPGRAQVAAMEKLGLVKDGKLVGMEMLEKGQWVELSKTLASHLEAIPEADRLGVESGAVGKQAGRALNILAMPAFTQNLPELEKAQASFLSGGLDEVIKALSAGDPLVEFRKTMGDFTNALMDLGKVVLPPLTAALQSIDDILKRIIPHLPGADGKPLDTGDMKTAAGFGGVVGAYFGGPFGAAVGATVGATSVGWDITQHQALDSGGVIDPTGMFVPVPGLSTTSTGDADKIAQTVEQSGTKAADRIVEAIGKQAGAIASAIASGHDFGKPPTDASGVDSRIFGQPLFPGTAH